jgi:ribosomal protein L40E
MSTVIIPVCRVDHPWSLPQPDDPQTRKARRVDEPTAMGFCKYCGDLIPKELEKCRKCGGVAVSELLPP